MRKIILLLFSFLSTPAFADVHDLKAEKAVRSLACKDGKSVDEVLKHKIKRHSQRDLGWRVFDEEGDSFDVERAILINKGMQIRYRWRLAPEENVQPISKRARELCLPD